MFLAELSDSSTLRAVRVDGVSPSTRAGHDVHLAGTRPVGEGTAQGGGLHLLGGPLGVVARLRAVRDATADELRRAGRALTGAAGALLPVRLLATTGRPRRESWCRACPDGPRPAGRRLPGASARCWPARRRSSAGRSTEPSVLPSGVLISTLVIGAPPFAAVLRNTTPPLGPGTAPLIRIRPVSASTRCTVRFWVVTFTWPMRPAMRRPLNTRPGVAQPPMEPGRAVLALHAVSGAEAVEAVALHDTRGALALAGASHVDDVAGLENLGGDLLAELVARPRRSCAARSGSDAGRRLPSRSGLPRASSSRSDAWARPGRTPCAPCERPGC